MPVALRFRKRTKLSPTAGGILVAFLGFVFLSITILVGWAALEGLESQERAATVFLPVEATVLHAEVEVRTSTTGTGSSRTTTTHHTPKFRYRYTVDGKEYESDQYAYFYASDEAGVKAAVASRPKGSTTTAYYDPEDPGEAVLHREAVSPTLAVVIIGGFGVVSAGILAFGVYLVVSARRRKGPPPTNKEGLPCPHCGMTYAFDGDYCRHCRRVK